MWGRRMFEECRIPNWCSKIKECLEECGLGSLWQRDVLSHSNKIIIIIIIIIIAA